MTADAEQHQIAQLGIEKVLIYAGNEWGPLGVAIAAADLTDRDALIGRLTSATPVESEPEPDDLTKDLRALLNRHSAENTSDTPDFILAQYLMGALDAYNKAVMEREKWFDRAMEAFRVTDVWREELRDAGAKVIINNWGYWWETAPPQAKTEARDVAEALSAAVLPLIEEHERAKWRLVPWYRLGPRETADKPNPGPWHLAVAEPGVTPVYVRELEPQPDETEA